jgi:tRNA threonylcarbamoyladenosine biosynthesis protein TsaB
VTILTLRTDKPEAELGLYNNNKQLAYVKWQAHLELSKTIHKEIEKILNLLSISLKDLGGIVCYSGPGSFTGLRIGLSVANTLAYAQNIPIVAKTGQDWIKIGIKELQAGKNDKITLPKYDRPAATTPPRK